ncbi:MAG: hypothetical protein ACREQ9_19235 [Candidatus Binatia bacterium]
MAVYLKSLGGVVALLGVLMGLGFVNLAAGDEEYRRAALMRERNPGNVLFESEFRVAEAKRVFLFYSSVGCFLTAVIGGSLLWGVGALHSKTDRLRAEIPDSSSSAGQPRADQG